MLCAPHDCEGGGVGWVGRGGGNRQQYRLLFQITKQPMVQLCAEHRHAFHSRRFQNIAVSWLCASSCWSL